MIFAERLSEIDGFRLIAVLYPAWAGMYMYEYVFTLHWHLLADWLDSRTAICSWKRKISGNKCRIISSLWSELKRIWILFARYSLVYYFLCTSFIRFIRLNLLQNILYSLRFVFLKRINKLSALFRVIFTKVKANRTD